MYVPAAAPRGESGESLRLLVDDRPTAGFLEVRSHIEELAREARGVATR